MQLQSVSSGKRKLEVDLQQLTQEHEELQGELRTTNDKAKKAVCEVLDININSTGTNAQEDVKNQKAAVIETVKQLTNMSNHLN